jgi:hypothetical protein
MPRMTPSTTASEQYSRAVEEAITDLVVRRGIAAGPTRTAWAIRAARAWLGPEVEPAPRGMHRHQADLRLRVSDKPSIATFRKAAFVDFGVLRPTNDGWEVEVGWRASTLAPLFPVFSGRMVAHADELTLGGWYAPPGGQLGLVADRVLLHIAATGTARWLLSEIDHAASSGAD